MASGDLQELIVRIKADTAALEAGLKNATAATKAATTAMGQALDFLKTQFAALVPALSALALVEFTKRSIEAEIELVHIAEKTGTSVEMLSSLDAVLRQNGGTVQDFANSMKFMNRNISEAATGTGPAVKAFQQLGLNASDLLKLSTDQRFFKITDAIAQFGNEADRTNLRMAILGRGAESLAVLMDQGSEAIRDAADHAASLGQAISKEQADNIKEFNDNLQLLIVSCERLAQLTFGGLIDLLKSIKEFSGGSITPLKMFGSTPIGVFIAPLIAYQEELVKVADAKRKAFDVPVSIPNSEIDKYVTWMQKSKAGGFSTELNIPDNGKKVVDLDSIKKQGELNKTIDDYIQKEKDANTVASQAKADQAGLADYYKLVNDLMDKGLPLQEAEIKIGPERKDQIIALGDAHAELVKQMQDAQRAADSMKRSFADALTNLAFNFKNAGQAAGDFFKTIAEQIFNKSIATPFSDAIVRALSSSTGAFSGIGKLLGISGSRAGGGPVSGGSSYLVGENGPEIFNPGMSGSVTPNNRIGGGGTVQVTQVFNMQPGLAETIGVAIRNAAPQIAAAAHASVFQAMQAGGAESRIIGARA